MGRILPGVDIFAEVKKKSPFGYVSPYGEEELLSLALRIGDGLSWHVDPRWGGSIESLRRIRKLTDLPIIAKGINSRDSDVVNAIRAGADWVLVVLGIEGRYSLLRVYLDRCIIEPMSLVDLTQIPRSVRRVAWNSRNLLGGGPKGISFDRARKFWDGYMIQASNISKKDDIARGANGILVGTHLHELAQSVLSL